VKLGLGASLIWAALLIRQQGGTTSDLVFFSGFLYLFLEPVMFMSWVAVVISQGFAAWKRVKELHALLVASSKEEIDLESSVVKKDSHGITMNLKFWEKEINLSMDHGKWTVL